MAISSNHARATAILRSRPAKSKKKHSAALPLPSKLSTTGQPIPRILVTIRHSSSRSPLLPPPPAYFWASILISKGISGYEACGVVGPKSFPGNVPSFIWLAGEKNSAPRPRPKRQHRVLSPRPSHSAPPLAIRRNWPGESISPQGPFVNNPSTLATAPPAEALVSPSRPPSTKNSALFHRFHR